MQDDPCFGCSHINTQYAIMYSVCGGRGGGRLCLNLFENAN